MSFLRFLCRQRIGAGAVAFALAGAFVPPPASIARHRAANIAAIDTAIARMGGAATLEHIERVRFEMMTLWQRLTFENRPSDLIGTYELHSDLRNYALGTWRNTRRFVGGPQMQEMTDIVGTEVGRRSSRSRPSDCCSPRVRPAMPERSRTRQSPERPTRA
jgi:hypothetical protein